MPKTYEQRQHLIVPTLFFVTTTLREWCPLFGNPTKRNEFEALLFSLTETHANALMGYVIMQDHIHLLVGCRQGGKQLSKFLQALKSLSSRRLFPGKGSIWMEGFDDFAITSEKQFKVKLDYIHLNPVKHGLASKAEDWRWSSAGFWMGDDPHPVLTKEWSWMDR